MRDLLPSSYKPKKMPKASKPIVAGPLRVVTAKEDSTKDEEASNFQGFESNDNNNLEVNLNGNAPPEM